MNFGCAMEIFTRNLKNPIRAIPHRVTSQENAGCCTYALFLDSTMKIESSNRLYEYIPNYGLKEIAKVDDFLEKIVANTYEKNGVGYY